MKPKTFYFDTTNTVGMNFSSKRQYGLIAQQVETVLPELVSNTFKPADKDTAGNVIHPAVSYKSLNYNAFIAILMKGMQEQQKTIDSLKTVNNTQQAINNKQDSINKSFQNQLNQLTQNLNSCCNANNSGQSSNNSNTNPINVTLQNGQTVVLSQNVPNPFSQQTTISYVLPANFQQAQILFYDAQNNLIQTLNLTQQFGTVNVFGSNLSSGIYTYSLVVDGQLMQSKKMIKL